MSDDTDYFLYPEYYKKPKDSFILLSEDEKIKKELKNLDESPEKYISNSTHLEKEFFKYQNTTQFLKDGFNSTIDQILKGGLLEKIKGKLIDGTEFYLTKFRIEAPSYIDTNGDNVKLTPMFCRKKLLTYCFKLKCKICCENKDKAKKYNDIIIKIPAMLGSDICHLKGLNDDEISELGESKNDPFGYFIIRGVEIVVLIQVRKRTGKQIMIIESKKTEKPFVSNTMNFYTNDRRSVITKIIHKKDSKNLINEYQFVIATEKTASSIINRSLNVFVIFNLLGIKDPEEIEDRILRMINIENRFRAKYDLTVTKNSYKKLLENDLLFKSYIQEIVTKQKKESSLDDDVNEFIEKLNNNLFPHMNDLETNSIPLSKEDIKEKKIDLLSLMISRLCKYNIGLDDIDDRDSWENKKIDSAGKSFEYLFMHLIRGAIENVNKNQTYNNFDMKIDTTKLNFELEESFVQGKWALYKKGNNDTYRNNMTNIMVRFNQAALYSHLTRITIPSSGLGKNLKPREITPTQLGYVCPVENPEGANCGLNLNLAVTSYITHDYNNSTVKRFIDDIVFKNNYDYEYSEKKIPTTINGIFIGWCNREIKNKIVKERRKGNFIYLSVVEENEMLQIYCEASRPTRPLFIIKNGKLVIDKKKLWNSNFKTLLEEGCVEYIDPSEQKYCYIAENLQIFKNRINDYENIIKRYNDFKNDNEYFQSTDYKLKLQQLEKQVTNAERYKNFTHMELFPYSIFSVITNLIPWANHNQAVRNVYSCNLMKKALSPYHESKGYYCTSEMKTLIYPQRSIINTSIERLLNFEAMPSGQNVIVAFTSYMGFTQEDSLVVKKEAIERGLFNMLIYHNYKTIVESTNNYKEYIVRPKINNEKDEEKYKWIDANGLPYDLNHEFKEGECIIGKVRVHNMKGQEQQKIEDSSIYVQLGEKGKLDKIFINYNDTKKTVIVKLRELRIPRKGDKITNRHSQKATIGLILSEAELPFVSSGPMRGIIPDIIVNPLCVASRQTIGLLFEIISSKSFSIIGENVDSTAFNEFDINYFYDFLRKRGYKYKGTENLISSIDGKMINSSIFMGPCYYQILGHLVQEKYQMRGTGAKSIITNGPTKGRVFHGGHRLGEMERDALISHGASYLIQERFCESSDKFQMVMCKKCGYPGHIRLSDKPFKCSNSTCDSDEYGKIIIPFVLRLLQNYLFSMGINLRLNVDSENTEDKLNINKDEISRIIESSLSKERLHNDYKEI